MNKKLTASHVFHLDSVLEEGNPLVELQEDSLKVLERLRVFQLVPRCPEQEIGRTYLGRAGKG